MAAAIVQTATGSTGAVAATSFTVDLTATTQGSSLVLLYGSSAGATGSVPSIASNGSLADGNWTKPDPPAGGLTGISNTYLATAYVHSIPSGITQLTLSITTARDQQAIVREVSGLANAGPTVALEDLTNAANSTTPSSPSGTPPSTNFAVGFVEHGGNPATGITGVSASWTLGPAPTAAGSVHLRDAYILSANGSAQQAVFSGLSAGVRYSGGLLAFAPSGAVAKTIGVSPTSLSFTWTG